MENQSNQPVSQQDEQKKKSRIPVYILIIIGIFFAAFIFYMLADREPTAGTLPVDTTIPATQDNSNTATATDKSAVSNTATAVAKDQ